MKLLNYFLILTLSFLIYSCDSTEPKPPDTNPPGYQKDILWPSLANSPWPMYRGDPQCTGRTKISIPISGTIYKVLEDIPIATGFAVSENDEIYFGVKNSYSPEMKNGGLIKISNTGDILWQYEIDVQDDFISNPIVTAEDNIFIAAGDKAKGYLIDNKGNLIWETSLPGTVTQTGITIDKNGTFYLITYQFDKESFVLNAISNSGKVLWEIKDKIFWGDFMNGMSLSVDGKLLFVSGGFNGPTLLIIGLNSKSILYTYGNERADLSAIPLVDSQNNIYVISKTENEEGKLFCLNSTTFINWEKYLSDSDNSWTNIGGYLNTAIDKNGNIYAGKSSLISINYEGNQNWQINLDGTIVSPISISGEYIFFIQNRNQVQKLLCVSKNNKLIFELVLRSGFGEYLSLAFSKTNLLIPDYYAKKIYLIK